MIDKSTLIYFFENALNSFISNFLFRDKHLLHEGKFKEFAQITIKRIQQSFGFLIFTALCFVFIGVFYLLKMLIPESSPWVGLAYIFNGVTIFFYFNKRVFQNSRFPDSIVGTTS